MNVNHPDEDDDLATDLDLNADPDAGEGDPTNLTAADRGDEIGDKPAKAKADDAEGEDEADGDDDDAKQNVRIPKARFDEVNTRRQVAEARNAQLEEQLAAARAANPAPPPAPPAADEPTVDLKALRRERAQAFMEGDVEKASEIEEKIEAEIESRATAKAMAAMDQRNSQQQFSTTVAAVIQTYPFLDSNNKELANAEAIQNVVDLRDSYIGKGMSPADALTKAANLVGKMYGTKPATDDPAADDPVAARRREIIARNAKTAGQPPAISKAGTGERAREPGKVSIEEMNDEEFEALPESEKRKLRGD